MSCPSIEKWILLSMGLLGDDEAGQLREHAQACEVCDRALNEAQLDHERLAQAYRAMDQNHESLRQQLLGSLPPAPPRKASAGSASRSWIGRFAMKHPVLGTAGSLAAAAAIIVIGSLFIDLGNGVAFAQVVVRLQEIDTIVCHMNRVMTGDGQVHTVDVDVYISEEHGFRADVRSGDLLVGDQPAARMFARRGGPIVTVIPETKTYIELAVSEDQSNRRRPGASLQRLGSLSEDAGEPLGQRVVAGRTVQVFGIAGRHLGFEDPTARAELWVDNETGLPVKLEISMPWTKPGWRAVQTYDRFEWNTELDDALFEPDIPADYTRVDLEMEEADEAALIRGLELFSELSGGAYPKSLDIMRSSREFEALLLERFDQDSDPDAIRSLTQKGLILAGASGFYRQLIAQNAEPAYFGPWVRAGQPLTILMYWQLGDEQMRVIYGDLRAETLPASMPLPAPPPFVPEPEPVPTRTLVPGALGKQPPVPVSQPAVEAVKEYFSRTYLGDGWKVFRVSSRGRFVDVRIEIPGHDVFEIDGDFPELCPGEEEPLWELFEPNQDIGFSLFNLEGAGVSRLVCGPRYTKLR